MFRRILCLAVMVAFVSGFSLSYAAERYSNEDYNAKMDALRAEFREQRDTYRQSMKQVDMDTLKAVRVLSPTDKAGRMKLIREKRQKKAQIQAAYREQVAVMRSQITQLKKEGIEGRKAMIEQKKASKKSGRK